MQTTKNAVITIRVLTLRKSIFMKAKNTVIRFLLIGTLTQAQNDGSSKIERNIPLCL
jgi:hypothetical protein